jgi:hypothetical protein
MLITLPALSDFKKQIREVSESRLTTWYLAIGMLIATELVDDTNKALLISEAITTERQRRKRMSTL